jgi:phosphoglycolate phosphatase-like HAD superfamily hydrolase
MGNRSYTKSDLIGLRPAHDSFVGIDSDGCVFDTMLVKQRNHFHPLIIKFWGLARIETQVRAAAEFVNLGSKWRGSNRFPSLLKTFDLLHEWDAAQVEGVFLPETDALRRYVESGLPLGNPSLEDEVARTGDPELVRLRDWSLAVNADIDDNMEPISPFKECLSCLEAIHAQSDAIVVSQTPEEALVKEWRIHGLDHMVSVIAGQELGSKAEHLQMAAGGKYPWERVLLIGDAPGDCKGAKTAGACFYPIVPGREEDSWRRLREESYGRFLSGDYVGEYEDRLIAEFEDNLPETPPWERGDR